MTEAVSFRTDPDADRFDLRGRTYAIPFDRVWNGALKVIDGLRGWTPAEADDEVGRIVARVESWPFRRAAEITVTVRLDSDGQTRVDVASAPESGSGGVGTAKRRIRAFVRALDAQVEASARTILDARTAAGESS